MDTKEKQRTIKDEINRVISEMESLSIDSEEYKKASELLKVLTEVESKRKVSPDVIVGAVTNILGILLVLNFEKFGIVTSKSFGFIKRT